MNLLVTGGSGFIGRHFIQRWYLPENMAQTGFNPEQHVLVNVDHLSYASQSLGLEALAFEPSYHFEHLDIVEENRIFSLLKQYQIQAVVHFAAQTHVDRSIDCVDPFMHSNVQGTLSLLKAIQRYSARSIKFLYVSTDEVYGSLSPFAAPATEYAPLKPSNPYAASKAAGEHFVQAWHNTYGLPTIISRCGNNYGVGQYPEKFIPLMLKRALSGQTLPVYGDGLQSRDWIAVEDHCDALRLLLMKANSGEIYNIGANNEWTNLEVLHLICTLLDEYVPLKEGRYCQRIEYVNDRLGHDRRYALNTDKIQRAFHWFPKVRFKEGLSQLVHAFVKDKICK